MAQKRPTKLRFVSSPDNYRIAEFEPGDFVGVSDGGTGADNSVQALSNLGGVPLTSKGQINGVAPLDGSGLVPVAHIPPVSLPEVFVVADATARLALTVQQGDEAIQTDNGLHYIYDGSAWYQRPVGGPGSTVSICLDDVYVNDFDKLNFCSCFTVEDAGGGQADICITPKFRLFDLLKRNEIDICPIESQTLLLRDEVTTLNII